MSIKANTKASNDARARPDKYAPPDWLQTGHSVFEQEILSKVEKQGAHLMQELALIPGVKEVRGAGLLLGIELESLKASDVSDAMRAAGVLVNAANATTIRIAPALIVTDAQINKFISLFRKVVADAK